MKEIHYSKVKSSNWFWPSFTPKELACKGDGLLLICEEALDKLQAFRELTKHPVLVNSAYRSEAYNKKVGGAPKSQHRLGKAFDIQITDTLSRERIHYFANLVGFTGLGDYDTFVHIDTGPKRYWDLRKGEKHV